MTMFLRQLGCAACHKGICCTLRVLRCAQTSLMTTMLLYPSSARLAFWSATKAGGPHTTMSTSSPGGCVHVLSDHLLIDQSHAHVVAGIRRLVHHVQRLHSTTEACQTSAEISKHHRQGENGELRQ